MTTYKIRNDNVNSFTFYALWLSCKFAFSHFGIKEIVCVKTKTFMQIKRTTSIVVVFSYWGRRSKVTKVYTHFNVRIFVVIERRGWKMNALINRNLTRICSQLNVALSWPWKSSNMCQVLRCDLVSNTASSSSESLILTSATSVAQVREPPEIAHADSEAESRHGEVQATAPYSTFFRRLFRGRWRHGLLEKLVDTAHFLVFPAGRLSPRRVSNPGEAGWGRALLAA